MADEYEDLVELGFEGVNKFADKYHDAIYGYADKHRPKGRRKRGKEQEGGETRGRQRAHARPGEVDGPESEGECRDAYAPNQDALSEYTSRAGTVPNYGEAPVVARDANQYGHPSGYGYQGGPAYQPRAPSPRYGPSQGRGYDRQAYGRGRYDDGQWDEGWTRRERPMAQQPRSWSYSPPRRSAGQQRYASLERRSRSKSPNDSKTAATVVGGLVGGLLGHAVRKDNAVATVAGAVIGGIASREAAEAWGRRKDKEHERRGRRRGEWR